MFKLSSIAVLTILATAGLSASAYATNTDIPNPCDLTQHVSIGGENAQNYISDPTFTTVQAADFDAGNQDPEKFNLIKNVWYYSNLSPAFTHKVFNNAHQESNLPANENAAKLTPTISQSPYLIQRLGNLQPGKRYIFSVCVYGNTEDPPAATISGNDLAMKTVAIEQGTQARAKMMGYLATDFSNPDDPTHAARTQNYYWTLYRFEFSTRPESDAGHQFNHDVYLILNGYKTAEYDHWHPNPNERADLSAYFLRPTIIEATPAALAYVPPKVAYEGNLLSHIKNGNLQNQSDDEHVQNGNFQNGLADWEIPPVGHGQKIDIGSVTDNGVTVKTAMLEHASTADDQTITLSQILPNLQPNSTYTVKADVYGAKAGSGLQNASAYISLKPNDVVINGKTDVAPSANKQQISFTFKTPANLQPGSGQITLSSYKQQNGAVVQFSNVQVIGAGENNDGGDIVPINPPDDNEDILPINPADNPSIPAPSLQPLVQDFGNYNKPRLDAAAWLLPNNSWGGDNNGVKGYNVKFVSNPNDGSYLRLMAYGGTDTASQYNPAPTLVGSEDSLIHTQRTGAAIVTSNLYSSGTYFVCARLPKHTGVVSAFWPFHYKDYQANQAGYWLEPNKIRNTEIDWEFSTSDLDNKTAPNYTIARANNWGGQLGGEGGNDTQRAEFGRDMNDGKFYLYAFTWYTGNRDVDTPANSKPGYVKWMIEKDKYGNYVDCANINPTNSPDSVLGTNKQYNLATVAESTGSAYGQDNIPYRAARFWIGDWFPGSSDYRYGVNGAVCQKDGMPVKPTPKGCFWGWGGTPDFNTDSLDIKWVAIYPGVGFSNGQFVKLPGFDNAKVIDNGDGTYNIQNARDFWEPENKNVIDRNDWSAADSADYPSKPGTSSSAQPIVPKNHGTTAPAHQSKKKSHFLFF